MDTNPEPFVIVGIDGSPASLSAARWAADAAARRHRGLGLLCAYLIPVAGHPESEYPPQFAADIVTSRQKVLAGVAAEVGAAHPGLPVTAIVLESDARRALVDASGGAGLTVIGSRGRGRLNEVLLGSVALHVASHGKSPVAVIPRHWQEEGGPVLVGADGSPNSEACVAVAFDEAAARRTDLVAILAWDDQARQRFARRPVAMSPADGQEEYAVLSEQLAGWQEKYPDVVVRQVVYRGHPAESLVRYGRHGAGERAPQLIVVGSRGRGGFSGLLLGSTSHTVITHAPCPVIVVRPAARV